MNPSSDRSSRPVGPVQRKVFDVMRPGRAPASSTSKPVIVGHKPMVQDTSVAMNGIGPRPLMNPHQKITVTSEPAVPGSPAVPVNPKPAVSVSVPVTSTAPALPAVPAPHPAAQPVAPAPIATLATPTPAPAPPHPITPAPRPAPAPPTPQSVVAPSGHPSPAAPASSALRPLEASAMPPASDDDILDNLPAPIVDKVEPVALPTQVGPKTFPWKTIIGIGIALIMALIVLDVLLDADFISWGVPHTHFFQ